MGNNHKAVYPIYDSYDGSIFDNDYDDDRFIPHDPLAFLKEQIKS